MGKAKLRVLWLVAFVLLLAASAFGSGAIVFISPSAAGPAVNPETQFHPLWVTWPEPTDGSGVNQLVSVFVMGSPSVSSDNFRMQKLGDGRYINLANQTLGKFNLPDESGSGYEVLSLPNFPADAGILAISACFGPQVTVVNRIDTASNKWCIAKAMGWDQVAQISRQTTEPTVVIEFPPPMGRRFSRAWTFERGKVVPDRFVGVVTSENASGLSFHPNFNVLNPGNSMSSGPPDRWLALGEMEGAIRAGLYGLLWLAIFVSLSFLASEKSNLTVRISSYTAFGAFFAVRMAPILVRYTGITLWWLWVAMLWLAVNATYVVADLNGKKGTRNSFALVSTCLILVSCFIPDDFSPLGTVYGGSPNFPLVTAAFDLALASFLFVGMKEESGVAWALSRITIPILAIVAYQGNLQIAPFAFLLLFRSKLVKGIGVGILCLCALMGVTDDGLAPVWQPYATAHQNKMPLNYFPIFQQVFRPEFAILVLGLLAALVFSSRFEAHRLVKTWKEQPAARTLLVNVGVVLALMIAEPRIIGILPWVVAFGLLLWSQEALRAL